MKLLSIINDNKIIKYLKFKYLYKSFWILRNKVRKKIMKIYYSFFLALSVKLHIYTVYREKWKKANTWRTWIWKMMKHMYRNEKYEELLKKAILLLSYLKYKFLNFKLPVKLNNLIILSYFKLVSDKFLKTYQYKMNERFLLKLGRYSKKFKIDMKKKLNFKKRLVLHLDLKNLKGLKRKYIEIYYDKIKGKKTKKSAFIKQHSLQKRWLYEKKKTGIWFKLGKRVICIKWTPLKEDLLEKYELQGQLNKRRKKNKKMKDIDRWMILGKNKRLNYYKKMIINNIKYKIYKKNILKKYLWVPDIFSNITKYEKKI